MYHDLIITCSNLLIYSALLPSIFASSLEPLWRIAEGGQAVGGCDDNLNPLKSGYEEAIEMAKKAIQAFENIEKPRPPLDEPILWWIPDRAETAPEAWDRQARLAKALLAIDVDRSVGIAGSSKARFDFAMASFKSITRDADTAIISNNLKHRVYCSPKAIVYYPPGDNTKKGGPVVDSGEPRNSVATSALEGYMIV
ncbi:hypothetical protein P7C71_g5065, partial [Lecanoromycetidae sp. Uapishka_2]